MAHMTNQLAFKAQSITGILEGKDRLKSLGELATALILTMDFNNDPLFEKLINRKCQFRY